MGRQSNGGSLIYVFMYLTRWVRRPVLHNRLSAFVICRWIPLSVRNVSVKRCRENQNILCSIYIYIYFFVDDVEEYVRSRQATDDNLIRRRKGVICLLVVPRKERRYTVIIFNIYCFFTATVVTRTRPNVTLYVHCLSCYSTRLFSLVVKVF